jgi:hypothetical protein
MILLMILKVLHLTAVAIWMGGSLTVPRDVRRTLGLGPPHTAELMPRLKGVAQLMNGAAGFTLLTGFALVVAAGGFANVPHRIHLGLFLTLLCYVAGRWLIRPVLGQLAVATKSTLSREDAEQLRRRLTRVLNVEHALRLAVLVLMVYPFAF